MCDRDEVELTAVASVHRAAKTRARSAESWASEETVSSAAPLSSSSPSVLTQQQRGSRCPAATKLEGQRVGRDHFERSAFELEPPICIKTKTTGFKVPSSYEVSILQQQ